MFSSGGKAPEFHLDGTYGTKNVGEFGPNTLFIEPDLVERMRDILKEAYFKTGTTSRFDGDLVAVVVIEGGNIATYVPQNEIKGPADPYMFE